jgi:sulfatase modifying factor 1
LLDMSGNVWELCSDYYGRLDFIPVVDPVGPTDGLEHVIRGGSWDESLAFCGSAGRNSLIPGKSEKNIGFRIAFSLSEPPKPSEDAHEFERSNDTDQ